MASPILVGITAVPIAAANRNRVSIRFQNTGATTIYIKKIPLTGTYSVVTTLNYEAVLSPSEGTFEAGEAFVTNSIAGFMAISNVAGGVLAVYETVRA